MKKIIVSAFALIALASCKKDYTCECTSSSNGIPSTTPSITIYKEVSKKTAQSFCRSYESTETENGNTDVYKRDCKLSKN